MQSVGKQKAKEKLRKELKGIVCSASLTAALSFLLFYSVDVGFYQYLGVFIPLTFFLLTKYFHKENIRFAGYISIIILVNLSVFLFRKYQESYWICFDFIDFIFIAYVLFNFLLLRIFLVSLFLDYCAQNNQVDNDEKLFSERKYELGRIKEMLSKYNIIGINAQWGDGKTFLFRILEKDFENEYLFLKIKVLSVTIDSVEKFILNEINYLLEKQSVFSITSSKIRGLLDQPILHNVGNVLLSANSFTKSFESIQNDVRKIGKPIVVVFEDIDRIEKSEIIFKIFSIVDMLSCDYIKFVYQYEEKELLKILKKDRCYLEKYIPYVTSLATIPFNTAIQFYCEENLYPNLKKEDFYFLSFNIDFSVYIPENVLNQIKIDGVETLQIPVFSIRKMQIFLDEIHSCKINDSFRSLSNPEKTIIVFYFIKHFCDALYQRIDLEKSFLDSKFFVFENELYSLKEIIKNSQSSEEIWKEKQNRQILILLIWLGYDLTALVEPFGIKEQKRKKEIDDFFENVSRREKNDKIDRVIKNLYAAGKSEYTNYEKFVRAMDDEVLSETSRLRESRYGKLLEKMFNGKIERDNHTIFRIAIPSMLETFYAYEIYENDPDNWIKLIDFYFKRENITEITPGLIRILCRCNLSYKEVYLHIIKIFNNLQVIGHLKDEMRYLEFLDKYLSAIASLRYISVSEVNWIDAAPNEWNIIKEKALLKLRKKLVDFASNSPLVDVKNEVSLMVDFIDKNIEIIDSPQKANVVSNSNGDDHKRPSLFDEHIASFKKKKLSMDELKEELKKGYKKGIYSAGDVSRIWDYFNNRKPE